MSPRSICSGRMNAAAAASRREASACARLSSAAANRRAASAPSPACLSDDVFKSLRRLPECRDIIRVAREPAAPFCARPAQAFLVRLSMVGRFWSWFAGMKLSSVQVVATSGSAAELRADGLGVLGSHQNPCRAQRHFLAQPEQRCQSSRRLVLERQRIEIELQFRERRRARDDNSGRGNDHRDPVTFKEGIDARARAGSPSGFGSGGGPNARISAGSSVRLKT